jgi:hypothetical protein
LIVTIDTVCVASGKIWGFKYSVRYWGFFAEILYPLFGKIWEEEKLPQEWERGLLVKIPKRGDLSNCDNWCGSTLLSVPSKVFNRVILNLIEGEVETKLREEQYGFRPQRSRTDLMY